MNVDGQVPIYLRVTVNGQRFEAATGRCVEVHKWSLVAGKAMGSSKEIKELNEFLSALQSRACDIQNKLMASGRNLTIREFQNLWRGVKENDRMLLEIFQHHNDQLKELVGRQYSEETYRRYETSLQHTRKFLAETYKLQDIAISALRFKFITDYEFWLKTKRNCNHNSAIKYLTNFKKIIHLCLKNGWLDRDPFVGFKMTKEETDRPYLTNDELEAINAKVFLNERLNQVKDVFLFSCYTGLAYADVLKLKRNEIVTGIDGEKWIFTRRQKTDASSRVPILPPAQYIVDKYNDQPQCENQGRLLPILSNQKMNAYLKEIADLCGINKNLTYHTARHTFATTVTLSNGVPIETVGKMLGHRNLKTTQLYARILDLKVSEDMKLLREKYKLTPSKNQKLSQT
jgi:site-specific recombinase XerD